MKKPSKEQKQRIKVWLKDYNKLEKQYTCPFGLRCHICERLFQEVEYKMSCPCQVLGLEEVIKRAKEWVKQ